MQLQQGTQLDVCFKVILLSCSTEFSASHSLALLLRYRCAKGSPPIRLPYLWFRHKEPVKTLLRKYLVTSSFVREKKTADLHIRSNCTGAETAYCGTVTRETIGQRGNPSHEK
jgi:hypothetical protein